MEGKFWKIPTGFEKATGLILETPIGRILFSHYPTVVEEKFFFPHIKVLNEIFHKTGCVLNIHGHTHSVDIKDFRCLNVSVEKTDFKPIRSSDVLKIS
jgi:calcineurin-like phosphoesterase family protein